MKTYSLFILASILLLVVSCRKQTPEFNQVSSSPNLEKVMAGIVQKHISQTKQGNSLTKSAADLVSLDSLEFYFNCLANASMANNDTLLVDFEDSLFSIPFLAPVSNAYSFAYLSSKVNLLKFSLQLSIPSNCRIYLVQSNWKPNLPGMELRVTIGKQRISLFKGTLGTLNSFASTDTYRMGYGNEFQTATGEVEGGRMAVPPLGQAGNGIVNEMFGKYVWYGGSINSALPTGTQKPAGAAKVMETYGNNNIFATYGWPSSAPTGYKYVFVISSATDIKDLDYKRTFTKGNPWYNPNQLTNRFTQVYPSLIFSKFCDGSEYLTNLSVPANPSYGVYSVVNLNSTQLNYYLNQIPSIYSQAKNTVPSNKVFVRLDIVPIYNYWETNCSGVCKSTLEFSHTEQLFTPFDGAYFPDTCTKLKYKYTYRFVFATRVLVPDPNAFSGL
ncbi:MAG: hypothetical protein CFE21_14100 [Bacteroidetes bacterium B1(2017)]|nr:MAG: hypothetical protein CFE21_14100 [Bacteroidetes bacterium B1(2017)]